MVIRLVAKSDGCHGLRSAAFWSSGSNNHPLHDRPSRPDEAPAKRIENDEFDAACAEMHRRAIGRENDGGSEIGWSDPPGVSTVAGEIGDAEEANIRVRLIAFENLVVALLAGAPDDQSDLVREMARYISLRPGATPHRLTIEAARNMLAIVARADQYRNEID